MLSVFEFVNEGLTRLFVQIFALRQTPMRIKVENTSGKRPFSLAKNYRMKYPHDYSSR